MKGHLRSTKFWLRSLKVNVGLRTEVPWGSQIKVISGHERSFMRSINDAAKFNVNVRPLISTQVGLVLVHAFLTSHHWTWPFEWFQIGFKGYLSKFTYKQRHVRSKIGVFEAGNWMGKLLQWSWTDSQYGNKSTKLKWNSFLTFRSHFVTF